MGTLVLQIYNVAAKRNSKLCCQVALQKLGYTGVGGAVSGDDDVVGEPDGESRGRGGVVRTREVICICTYVPFGVPVLGFKMSGDGSSNLKNSFYDGYRPSFSPPFKFHHGTKARDRVTLFLKVALDQFQ